MFREHDFSRDDGLFLGDNLALEFEILSDQPELDESDPEFESADRVPEDVTGWEFAFYVKLKDTTADPPLIEKRTGSPGGVTIEGTYNADRATNTQRVLVTIDDSDTDSSSDFAQVAKTYRYALKRMNTDFERVLVRGKLPLLKATTPDE